MSPSPLVSVIVPCYNYGRFLAEALDSILLQTYKNWECIIVNDGSSDTTEAVALSYRARDKRFVYVSQSNSGLGPARNVAIQHSKGEYLQLLDADDMLQPEKLRLQVEIFESNPHVGLVYSDVLKFENKPIAERVFTSYHQPEKFPASGKGEDLIESIMFDNIYLPGCIIMRRKVFDDVNEEGFKKSYGFEDWEYWFRAAYTGWEFHHDDRKDTKLLTRHHTSNLSGDLSKMWSAKLKVRREILNTFIKHNQKGKLKFSADFITKTINEHKRLLSLESVMYHMVYGNLIKGSAHVISHAYYSRRPFFAIYDALHFFKLRFKKPQPWVPYLYIFLFLRNSLKTISNIS